MNENEQVIQDGTTADYLQNLVNDRDTLVTNLVAKGVEASNVETFTELVPKVLDIQPNLETKSITITENTTTTITPTSGKDGLSSVEITTNVPSQKFAFVNGGGGITFYGSEKTQEQMQNEIDNIVANVDTSSITIMNSMFYACSQLTSIDLSGFDASNVVDTTGMFVYCMGLVKIDMRSFDFTNISSYGNMFGNANVGVPNNCEIIVADDTQKAWLNTNFSRMKNVKTVAEYEAEQGGAS